MQSPISHLRSQSDPQNSPSPLSKNSDCPEFDIKKVREKFENLAVSPSATLPRHTANERKVLKSDAQDELKPFKSESASRISVCNLVKTFSASPPSEKIPFTRTTSSEQYAKWKTTVITSFCKTSQNLGSPPLSPKSGESLNNDSIVQKVPNMKISHEGENSFENSVRSLVAERIARFSVDKSWNSNSNGKNKSSAPKVYEKIDDDEVVTSAVSREAVNESENNIHNLIVSYVAVISIDRDKIFGTENTSPNPKNLFDYINGASLPMIESVIIPNSKKALKEFPPGLNLFVFPSGAKIERSKKPPFLHQFVLTMVNGSRLYGTSICKFSEGSESELTTLKSGFASYLMENPDATIELQRMPSNFYVPSALVILSAHPFHNRFMKLVQDYILENETIDFNQQTADDFYQCLHKTLPCAGETCISHLGKSPGVHNFTVPKFIDPPLCDLNFLILFRLLEPRHVIKIFNAMLSEIPILVVSDYIELLCPVCEAFMAFLYPLKWPFLYIPVLPVSLIDIIQAPQPFLIGCKSDMITSPIDVKHALLVNLDLNTITHHNSIVISELPWRLSWRLFRSISKYMNMFKFCHPDSKILPPENLPKNATNDFEYSSSNTSILGSKSVLSYKTVSDLFSGSEPEDADSKFEDSPYNNPSDWIEPGILIPQADEDSASETEPLKLNNLDVIKEASSKASRSPSRNELDAKARPSIFQNPLATMLESASKHIKRSSSKSPSKVKYSTPEASPNAIISEESLEENGQLLVDIQRIRRSFLSVLVSLLSGYRDFIRVSQEKENETSSNKPEDEEEIFDRKAFIRDTMDESKRKFMDFFTKTQMFDFFIQERVARKEIDWFDKSCLSKLRFEVTNLQKNASRQKMGGLWKKGSNFKTWKWRMFILGKEMDLEYFTPSDKLNRLFEEKRELEQKRVLHLTNSSSIQREIDIVSAKIEDLKSLLRKGTITLTEGTTEVVVPESSSVTFRTAYPFDIITGDRTLSLCAADAEERRDWIRLIRAKTQKNRQVLFKRFLPTAKQQARLLRIGTFESIPHSTWVKDQKSLEINKELCEAIQFARKQKQTNSK